MIINNRKNELRKHFFKIRKTIKRKKHKECIVNLRLFEFLKVQKQRTLAGYLAVKGELNIVPVTNYLREFNFNISLPYIEKKNKPLLFKNWNEDEKLEPGMFNIKVPKTNIFSKPDIILVPLLAFNNRKFRLGYGGGFYDRTILDRKKEILSIGIGFDEQESNKLPVEKYDQNLDMIITPNRLIT